jgi:hypothetical protein
LTLISGYTRYYTGKKDNMQTFPKQQIAEWILLDYLAKSHYLKDKIDFFKKKYNTTILEFEESINNDKKENFQKWDDYIEWKAFTDFSESLQEKIQDVKNGNFQLAE